MKHTIAHTILRVGYYRMMLLPTLVVKRAFLRHIVIRFTIWFVDTQTSVVCRPESSDKTSIVWESISRLYFCFGFSGKYSFCGHPEFSGHLMLIRLQFSSHFNQTSSQIKCGFFSGSARY